MDGLDGGGWRNEGGRWTAPYLHPESTPQLPVGGQPSMQSYPRANGTESRPGPGLENPLEKFRHLDLSHSQYDMEAGSLGLIMLIVTQSQVSNMVRYIVFYHTQTSLHPIVSQQIISPRPSVVMHALLSSRNIYYLFHLQLTDAIVLLSCLDLLLLHLCAIR